jgi:hypothetical protein
MRLASLIGDRDNVPINLKQSHGVRRRFSVVSVMCA